MNTTLRTKVNKFLVFLLIVSTIACVSYFIVYKLSFLPNGYDIVSVQKDSVSLKSFNLLGIESDVITVSFSGKNPWEIDEIGYAVNRQKEFFWLLFFAVSVSTSLLFYKVHKGVKLWKASLESNIIFAVLIPLYPIIDSLNRIQHLISRLLN